MIFKPFETPIWNGKQNCLTGLLVTDYRELRETGPWKYGVSRDKAICIRDHKIQ